MKKTTKHPLVPTPASDSTMHYATFDGPQPDGECWIIRRSCEPEDSIEITENQASQVIGDLLKMWGH